MSSTSRLKHLKAFPVPSSFAALTWKLVLKSQRHMKEADWIPESLLGREVPGEFLDLQPTLHEAEINLCCVWPLRLQLLLHHSLAYSN